MSTDTAIQPGAASTDANANQNKFLSFCLGQEEYGVEILRVREIIGLIDITPLPQTPEFVKGVINLRGKIIPVIELRARFAMDPKDYTDETCVIVVEVSDPSSDEMFQIGAIVDNVSEVLDVTKDQIEPAPRFGGALTTDYILGMGKVKNKVLILLDIDKVLGENQFDLSGDFEAQLEDEQNHQPTETVPAQVA